MRETGTLPYSFVFSMQNRFSGVFRTGLKKELTARVFVTIQNRFHGCVHIDFIPYPVYFSQRILITVPD